MPECIAHFFTDKEVTDVIEEAKKPLQPHASISEISSAESDSEPSCDNFDSVDISENFKNVLDEKQLETFLDLKRKTKQKVEIEENKVETETFNFVKVEADDRRKRKVEQQTNPIGIAALK